jgi:thioredoxin-related protein
MKSISCIIIALCCLMLSPLTEATAKDTAQIKWVDFDKAQKQGETQPQKFFLYFYADWCGYCRKLEKSTFTDKSVANYINKNFIPVRINSERMPKVAARYGVQSFPDMRFLTPEGENIARWPGYIEAEHLLPLLKYIKTDSYQKMNYQDFLKSQ